MRYSVAEPLLGDRELAYVTDALQAGEVSSIGSYVRRFEEAYAVHCGVRHALATSNGTTALHLALMASGVGPGDEVLVPALTFVATANVAVYCGATPVFVDVHPDYWGIDPVQAAAKITPRTKAIIAVHLYGHPADMGALRRLADEHGLALIEDAAEAHGAEYQGKRVGSLGDVGSFSFYGNKIMTTGEGGMITTDSDELAGTMRQLRDQGTEPGRRYWHPVVGYNYRLSNLPAAVGLAQLEQLDMMLGHKQRILEGYRSGLAGAPLRVQQAQPWAKAVNWLTCVVLDDDAPLRADALMAGLDEQGIETRPFFVPLPQLPPYFEERAYPVADRLGRQGLNLPSGASLTDDDVATIARVVVGLFAG